jgi:hypothetical protein
MSYQHQNFVDHGNPLTAANLILMEDAIINNELVQD